MAESKIEIGSAAPLVTIGLAENNGEVLFADDPTVEGWARWVRAASKLFESIAEKRTVH